MKRSKYQELRSIPMQCELLEEQVKPNPRELVITLVSCMCDNKSTMNLKKNQEGDFKLTCGGQAYSNFQIKFRKDEIEWALQRDGRLNTAGGLRLTPYALIKVGAMLLGHGSWAGRQIIDASWLEESTDEINPGYGYLWGVGSFETKNSIYNLINHAGYGGQRLLVVPELNLVVDYLICHQNVL